MNTMRQGGKTRVAVEVEISLEIPSLKLKIFFQDFIARSVVLSRTNIAEFAFLHILCFLWTFFFYSSIEQHY